MTCQSSCISSQPDSPQLHYNSSTMPFSNTKKRMYSKNGCETCKRRKVKCDETYPRCRRCESTGRTCSVYRSPVSVSLPSLYAFVPSASDRQMLEWFKLRTVTKVPGTFRCDFWSKLILQAATSQPAPRHAALALGAAHRRLVLGESESGGLEMLVIRHHSSAITHLQSCFSTLQDTISLQVILTVCLIFASLDSLRGHLASAQHHVRSGLAILKLSESTVRTQMDEWITEAFSRLQLQLVLLRPSCASSVSFIPQGSSSPQNAAIPRRFRSLKSAWKSLAGIMVDVILLHRNYSQSISDRDNSVRSADFVKQQHFAQSGLRRWQTAYQNSCESGRLTDLSNFSPAEQTRATANIAVYHVLTTIMAQLCLCPDDEMAYDTQNFHFAQLLQQLQALFGMKEFENGFVPKPGATTQLDHSIIDLGCIIPLYYLATKCRVHNLRISALQMLQSIHHREGLWDAHITSLIAQKVIQLEEGGLNHECISHNQSSSSPLSNSSPLPDAQRIGGLEIVLAGNPTDRIRIFGTTSRNRQLAMCVSEFSVTLETLPLLCTTNGLSMFSAGSVNNTTN